MTKNAHNWVNDAWLGLGDISLVERSNPLFGRTKQEIEYPGRRELKLMKDPNYLAFACQVLLNIHLIPEQAAILEELWTRPFPMYIASRGFGKSFMLAVYAMLKCALCPGTKVVIVGAAFRQSKVIFEYMETIWKNAPVLRSICDTGQSGSGPRRDTDRCTMRINDSWAIAVPLGDGTKIRGLRAHIIIADEFNSIPPDIYETVVAGFAAVSSDPINNVKEAARRKAMTKLGIWTADAEKKYKAKGGNQAILSGTAGYDFQHFAEYWRRYRDIINTGGSERKLCSLLGVDAVPDNFDWRDYSVMRIPYELIPEGFMDDRQVTRAKATIHSGIYQMEYGAVFTADSDGFFKRTLIERCVTSDIKPVALSKSGEVWFDAKTRGSSAYKYVYGIDPASEQDNFSIVILELHEDHTRVVHVWTTSRKDFKERIKAGLADKLDFYGYCARKIRDLMKVFPCEAIAMDAQGGGVAVEEALHDPDKMEEGEIAIWPVIDPDKEKDTDIMPGKHILHLCQFAKADWTAEANHGLRKDLEDRVLLFPRFDPLSLELAAHDDGIKLQNMNRGRQEKDIQTTLYDTLEDCVMEIEELKDELCTITLTRTGTGVNARDRWDTPEIKMPNGKKGRLRKDRYSSIVMANMVARGIHRAIPQPDYEMIGGFSHQLAIEQRGQMYQGPDWYTSGMTDDVVFGVNKRG